MTTRKTSMSIGVLGAGERQRPLLLRLSEHSQRIRNHGTFALHTCYRWDSFR